MDESTSEEVILSTYGTMALSLDSDVPISAFEELSSGGESPGPIRVCSVRDYRDRYILAMMQKGALAENPGFRLFKFTNKAKIIWVGGGIARVPAGYYIYSECHRGFSKLAGREVCYPRTLHQIFVVKDQRKRGLATRMVKNFVSGNRGSIWVESPKYETRMLLEKLGFEETSKPYELWQMMDGLTKWSKRSKKRRFG